MDLPINNLNVASEQVLSTPSKVKMALPMSPQHRQFIQQSRNTIANIIHKNDPRMLVISGPCSIHDIEAAKDYALKLKSIQQQYQDSFLIVMRVYFEKPRTTVGWKGLINDPNLDGSCDIETGLYQARELLLWLADQEIAVATEALDPISPQYLMDLVSWVAVGARTTESQTHREMASGLSAPVGFKNGTDGNTDVAINAMKSASSAHRFIGINQSGQVSVINTVGNKDAHIILRGGKTANYHSDAIALCEADLCKANVTPSIIVDCSHANSNKDYTRQPLVALNVADQIVAGNDSIVGLMLESHLCAGNQSIPEDKTKLRYGISITDACIDWDTTTTLLEALHKKLKEALNRRCNSTMELAS
ncbi:3-deoxy-7-phosphoheptulonate synthase [Flocculibacter collagenilyticus]|uniref:3-deoxy-7-phosphoheptulonate synthase n=1 Tax=Flocculibacter collagenilyticus TaxID=2744479 RepID=UPI0018F4B2F2|nr:3-deoxy-7-phosphoheptulonate synthase [Flocculibacter collagenilyticus]